MICDEITSYLHSDTRFESLAMKVVCGRNKLHILDLKKRMPCALIVNTRSCRTRRSQCVGHWVCFYGHTLSRNVLYFFDPMGKSHRDYHSHFTIFNESFDIIDVNLVNIQSTFSRSCGELCLYFVSRMLDTDCDVGAIKSEMYTLGEKSIVKMMIN